MLTEMRVRSEAVSRHNVYGENCLFFRGIDRIDRAEVHAEWQARTGAGERLALFLDDPEEQVMYRAVPDGPSPLNASIEDVDLRGSGLLRVVLMVNETAAVAEQPVALHVSISYHAQQPLSMERGICSQL